MRSRLQGAAARACMSGNRALLNKSRCSEPDGRCAASLQVRTKTTAAPAPAPVGAAGRLSALAAALRQIESNFGKGAVMQLGQKGPPVAVDCISTGSLALDHALGVGGLPRGRVVEIYGAESSGKTTLALHVVAQAQKRGLSCCFVDAEHALDPLYAKAVGVDLDALYLSQPDSGEQALEIADTLVRSGAMDVLVVDSVAALVPRAEIEGEMGDHHMALQARLMSQALRKLTASLARSKTLIIFINQIRQKVGVLFGNPDVTPGGNALKFYSSIRMEIKRTGQVKRGEDIVGNLTKVKVSKNKLAPPFRTAEFEMSYGSGINRAGEAVDLGVTFGILRKSGAWYAVANQTLLDAVNKALAAPSTSAAAAVAAAPVEAAVEPAPAAPTKGKKGKKSAAAAAAAESEPTVAPVAAPAAVAAAATEPASAAPSLELNDAFMQGKEKMKAFFEAHPPVLEVAVELIRAAMKERAANAPPEPEPLSPMARAAAMRDGVPLPPSSSASKLDDDELDADDEEIARGELSAVGDAEADGDGLSSLGATAGLKGKRV